MKAWLQQLRKGYGKKLASLHRWNAWIVVILAVSGLILLGGFWREVLGAGRIWLKWLHIIVGLAMLVPVIYYLLLAGKHWKQLRDRPWQKVNTIIVLILLVGWFISGVLLWQFKAVGPRWSGQALWIHDLLTWVGLPYIIYHSITRTKWLKDTHRRAIPNKNQPNAVPEAESTGPQPFYTRRAFLRTAVGAGAALTLGPTFIRWAKNSIAYQSSNERYFENDANRMSPAPHPLPQSAPPIGGGAEGNFRVYTVTDIPSFTNTNWSFSIDGLVNKPMTLTWEQFLEIRRSVQVSDFYCVTGWSVFKNTWEGIPLTQLLKMAGVKPEAATIKFYSGDGVYTDAISLEQNQQMGDVLVAVMHDGKLIPSDLGGPVRLIVPQMYAYKSVKWLNRIELIAEDHIGYWEERGYDKDAWVPSLRKKSST
ncbi:molybdopterin-dependent oxidoreductase [Paenibacillus sp. JX-17]|uniref:Molybdopterin-dependent oxidoreductase n=1 Tax=Paenibacillus lacisoli TaxID=3064525 RepID=A0ABT9CHW5_9BACL|nr:molybdopterin-dependent oxidoreductase [Paenibacillus sp. JX-17]MDO7908864.1 molybdopterin-dependent oxidoreductase [Paenibacillus sp. JX-17]